MLPSFNNCKSVDFDRGVNTLAACQQSNFSSFVFVFVLNLAVLKGVRFIRETIERRQVRILVTHLNSLWATAKNTAFNSSRNHPSSGGIISS